MNEIEKLRQENTQLRTLLEERTKLLSKTIHDLSSPITIASFEVQKVLEATQPNYKESLKSIDEALDRVIEMIDTYKKAREEFVERGVRKKIALKKLKSYLSFYLGQEILMNDIVLTVHSEEDKIDIDEEFFLKNVLRPIFKELFSNINGKEVILNKHEEDSELYLSIDCSVRLIDEQINEYNISALKVGCRVEYRKDLLVIVLNES